MRILALDQASRITGWAVFDGNTLLKYDKFAFDDYDFGLRLQKIRNKVKSLIEEYEIDKVYFEDIQLQSSIGDNVATFKKLAEVFGVIYELLTELNIPNEAILSTVWKAKLNLLHGRGQDRSAQKRAAQDYVVQNYKIKPTQDECDAICIGVYGILTNSTNDWSD